MASHNEFGAAAEVRAAAWLEARGWQVLDRNWRWHHKELDLVIRQGDIVAFVEVRARQSDRFGHPAETVTWRKRREVAAVACAWAARHGRAGDRYRFDIVAIIGDGAPEHLEAAWQL